MIQFNLLQAASRCFEIETRPRMRGTEMKNQIDQTAIGIFCQNIMSLYMIKKIIVKNYFICYYQKIYFESMNF